MSKGARQINKERKKFSHLTCEDGEIGKRNGLKIRQPAMALRVQFPLFAPNHAPIVQRLVHLAYIQRIGVRVPVGVPLCRVMRLTSHRSWQQLITSFGSCFHFGFSPFLSYPLIRFKRDSRKYLFNVFVNLFLCFLIFNIIFLK